MNTDRVCDILLDTFFVNLSQLFFEFFKFLHISFFLFIGYIGTSH